MSESQLVKDCWIALDLELDACVTKFTGSGYPEFGEMIRYQLGWNGKGFDTTLTGKRIRPLLLLLTTHALGGDWRSALPAAAALELVHNFSLVHDDIQDNSEKRRGRDTVWIKWGMAQAINTGDAMLAIANLEIMTLEAFHEPALVKAAARLLSQATLELTRGQYLDLVHERAEDLRLNDYYEMVKGKTGALFSVCLALGALIAGKEERALSDFVSLGGMLGLAFQIQDDYLGIWGQDGITGKSVVSDLLSRKKTFPVHFALETLPDVRDYWIEHEVFSQKDVLWLKQHLEIAGVDKKAMAEVDSHYAACKTQFSSLFEGSEKTEELFKLVNSLFIRNR